MSKTGEMVIRMQEQEMMNNTLAIHELTEREFITLEKEKMNLIKEEIKTPKIFVYKGVVESIEKIASKYGHNYRIGMGSQSYYFNSKHESTCEKLFEKGKMCAFTIEEKGEKKYKIIKEVLYCF